MKERLLEFLRAENKSSAQLADEIGVQPSGISHILSGRNNPSLDFVLKMLEKYKHLSSDWLLFGKGSMYKGIQMQNLFDEIPAEISRNDPKSLKNEDDKSVLGFQDVQRDKLSTKPVAFTDKNSSKVKKIAWFYDDGSFDEYFPRP
jgi:transcriptional regulator with XRE-family HTH domain